MLVTYSISGYWFLLAITLTIIGWLLVEVIRHRRHLASIPVRVHVNGTRGKSSVTRLIAAGLRAGGLRTCAKTTGTLARFIDPTGKEETIFRRGHTNVIEQVKIFAQAAACQAEVIVIECMAVQPLLQALCEEKLVRSTHGVLCNARPDHLDVMGPTEDDVALALAGTMPVKGQFFTPERRHLGTFKMAAADRGTEVIEIDEQAIAAITEEDMAGFDYAEHEENVALALRLCDALGVAREVALRGMWEATPDPGATTVYTIHHNGHRLILVNGFAANDPLSTGELWHRLREKSKGYDQCIALVNCRADRHDRSAQLVEAIVNWDRPDSCLVIGGGVKTFIEPLQKAAFPIEDGSSWTVPEILDHLGPANEAPSTRLVIGMCNIANLGFKLVEYFRSHQETLG